MNKSAVVAKAEMMIRKPVAEVFEAFINPEITAKFWFTKGSARLEAGKQVQWDWEMYGATAQVDVKAIEPNKRILIEWESYGGRTTVEWQFTARSNNETMVTIQESGFVGDDDQVVKGALESTEAFTIVICGLKAYLEHNILLNLIGDKFPDAHVKS
jgi:uncharacterized protein YndB with AHSA1/START domain